MRRSRKVIISVIITKMIIRIRIIRILIVMLILIVIRRLIRIIIIWRRIRSQLLQPGVPQLCGGGLFWGRFCWTCHSQGFCKRCRGVLRGPKQRTMQQEQGITVEARMHSRAYPWGIQKWRARKMQFYEELKDMQAELQVAMEEAEELPRHKMWQLRSCLSGWGVDFGSSSFGQTCQIQRCACSSSFFPSWKKDACPCRRLWCW